MCDVCRWILDLSFAVYPGSISDCLAFEGMSLFHKLDERVQTGLPSRDPTRMQCCAAGSSSSLSTCTNDLMSSLSKTADLQCSVSLASIPPSPCPLCSHRVMAEDHKQLRSRQCKPIFYFLRNWESKLMLLLVQTNRKCDSENQNGTPMQVLQDGIQGCSTYQKWLFIEFVVCCWIGVRSKSKGLWCQLREQ